MNESQIQYDRLKKARETWISKSYTNNPYKTQLEAQRDNDLQFIEELMRRYEVNRVLNGRELLFAENLVRRANR